MSQLRKPLTAGAVDEYLNHIKARLDAGDNAAQLETQLTTFDSDSAGAVVKQRLAQVIAGLKNTRALTNGQVSASINSGGTGYSVGDVIPVIGDVGNGNGCAIRVTSVGGSGEITGIEVSGGEGYVSTATADTSGVGNEDATFTFTISNELNIVETMAASIEAAS